jgi:hypothetical protein
MGKPDKSKQYRNSNTKARSKVGIRKYGPYAHKTLNKFYAQIKSQNLPISNTKFFKRKAQELIKNRFLQKRGYGFNSKPLPGKLRTAGKYRGGANNFKRKVNNTIKSRKPASQTRYSNVNVLKSAFDQLNRKLDKCEKKNKKLKESNIELSAWKHSMIKLTEKINRGNI